MGNKTDKAQWTVNMIVERNISVCVEADNESEARAKVEDWDVLDEQEQETINWKITSISKDE